MSDVAPQTAIERVRRGHIVEFSAGGRTFRILKPEDADEIVHEFAVKSSTTGHEFEPYAKIDSMTFWYEVSDRDIKILPKTTGR